MKAILILSVICSYLKPLLKPGKAGNAIRTVVGLVLLAALLSPLASGIQSLESSLCEIKSFFSTRDATPEADYQAFAESMGAELTAALSREFGVKKEWVSWEIDVEETDGRLAVRSVGLAATELPLMVTEGMVRNYLGQLMGCPVTVNGKGE